MSRAARFPAACLRPRKAHARYEKACLLRWRMSASKGQPLGRKRTGFHFFGWAAGPWALPHGRGSDSQICAVAAIRAVWLSQASAQSKAKIVKAGITVQGGPNSNERNGSGTARVAAMIRKAGLSERNSTSQTGSSRIAAS